MPKRGQKGRRRNGDGTIYERKNGTYAATFTIEGGKRKTIYAKTYKEAQEKLKKALYEQQQGTLITAPQQTIAQFLRDWLESTQVQSVRPRTYERYEEIVRLHIIPVLGKHQLQKLAAQQVQTFYAKKLKEGLSSTTVNTIHNVFHKALDTAKKWKLIFENVCDLVSPPRSRQPEFKPLTLEQVRVLLDVARGHPIEALLTLALATGMRRGELLGLKWQDIDFKAGTLQVRRVMTRFPTKMRGEGEAVYREAEPKTKRSRRNITIVPFAVETLKQHRQRQAVIKEKAGPAWQERDLVFCTSLGTPVHPTRGILDPFKALLKLAGLPNIRFHDLRHSAATLLLGMDVHPKIVQEILGHSNISITLDIYSHVLPSMQRDAMSRLNDAFMRQENPSSQESDRSAEEGNPNA